MSRARDLADGTFSGSFSADSPTLVVDDANNRVGIGTSSPNNLLTLNSNTANTAMTIQSSDTGGAAVVFGDQSDFSRGRIVYDNSDDSMAFEINNLSEAMRIDSSGKVGIGTSSPSNYYANHLVVDIGSSAQSGITIVSDTTSQGMFAFADGTTGDQRYRGAIDYNHSNDRMAFLTGGAERMSIDALGRPTLSSTHTSNYGLTLTNSASSGVPEGIDIVNTGISVDSTAGHFLRCRDNTATRCVIDLNGNLRNHDNSYGAISDERAKQDIVDASSQWDDIKVIQVRKYKKIDDVEAYGDNAQLEIGVIAQELEASGMGGLVNTPENADEMKSVKYSILYMKAVKALQEAMERIETLEAKVATLENA